MARKVFFSFHYEADNWRTSQVRNIGSIEGSKEVSDNDWEQIKRGGDIAIKNWISKQLQGTSCTVVLVGSGTANRKWINHEIIQSWEQGKGVVGIHIHGLKDRNSNTSSKGYNPFDYIRYGNSGKKLSSVVHCYDPVGITSTDKYDWIRNNISAIVERAIKIRNNPPALV
jgi:hypothetical protein